MLTQMLRNVDQEILTFSRHLLYTKFLAGYWYSCPLVAARPGWSWRELRSHIAAQRVQGAFKVTSYGVIEGNSQSLIATN